jgi:hypothetical protein
MGMGRNGADALVMAAEGPPGTISERAPVGRLFAAISTLADMAATAGEASAPEVRPQRMSAPGRPR